MRPGPTEKISSIVRSAAVSEYRSANRAAAATAVSGANNGSGGHWDDRPRSREGVARSQRRELNRSHTADRHDRHERQEPRQPARNDSGGAGVASVGDYADTPALSRRHDYDVHSMEANLSPRASVIKNPIPPPTVAVRSEFPTLTKSRQQQALTCLVTVEVPATLWRPDPDDVRVAATMVSNNVPATGSARVDDASALARPMSPSSAPPPVASQPFFPTESAEVLEAVTDNLRARVDNWHGLDFRRYLSPILSSLGPNREDWMRTDGRREPSRFGKLRLYGNVRVGKDRQTWQELECYLFSEMLICVKEKRGLAPSEWDDTELRPKSSRCTLKGSILIKKHLKQVTESSLQRMYNFL